MKRNRSLLVKCKYQLKSYIALEEAERTSTVISNGLIFQQHPKVPHKTSSREFLPLLCCILYVHVYGSPFETQNFGLSCTLNVIKKKHRHSTQNSIEC
jgi:hypothetical protein